MRVLVTGSRGRIGRRLVRRLQAAGMRVANFDLRYGKDVRDPEQVKRAIAGCDAVVHLAALLPSPRAGAREMIDVNTAGTVILLAEAVRARAGRFVYMSSVNALGVFRGESLPDYLPIDDSHPARPRGDYGLSKLLAEEACASYSLRFGLTSVCLRPPGVWLPDDYERTYRSRRRDPLREARPFWEYGAFIDIRDLVEAVLLSLTRPLAPGSHHRLLVCAEDVMTSSGRTARELARERAADVPWRGGSEYEREPQRALVDCSRARDLLGWRPEYSWRAFLEARGAGRPAGRLRRGARSLARSLRLRRRHSPA